MNRISVLNALLSKTKKKRYLEIGVRNGQCFLEIKGHPKFAVDPMFVIPKRRLIKKYLWNPYNFSNKFFSQTSDEFFDYVREGVYAGFKWDVIFIDGLHTYEQSLLDIENSLSVLDDNGFIVLHDCNPRSVNAATPANSYEEVAGMGLKGWNGVWNGEVWKSIIHVRRQYPDLLVAVLDCDYGIGIITRRGAPEALAVAVPADLRLLNYTDLDRDRNLLLNLKAPAFIDTFQQG